MTLYPIAIRLFTAGAVFALAIMMVRDGKYANAAIAFVVLIACFIGIHNNWPEEGAL